MAAKKKPTKKTAAKKASKPVKKSVAKKVRKTSKPKRIEENRHGLQPAYIGDRVWWDDDEEGFTGEYKVTSIGEEPEDQHRDTSVWLYSADRGKEVEVGLREIQNRIMDANEQ